MRMLAYTIFTFSFFAVAAGEAFADDVERQKFLDATKACGAGISAEATSTFEEAFDLAEAKTPGRGTANVNTYGIVLLQLVGSVESDDAKLSIIEMYFQCLKPAFESE